MPTREEGRMSTTATRWDEGPWEVRDGVVVSVPIDKVVTVEMPDGPREHHTGMVAIVYGHHVDDHYTLDANKSLIAEAPAMAALLGRIIGRLDSERVIGADMEEDQKLISAARSLLARLDAR